MTSWCLGCVPMSLGLWLLRGRGVFSTADPRRGFGGVKIDRLSVTRSRGLIDFCYPARRAGREDYLGEEASMGVMMMGDEGW